MADITLDDLFAADSQSGGGAAPSLSDLLDSDEQSQKNWGTGPKQAIEAVTGPSAAQQIEIAKRAPKGSINFVEELTPPPPTLGEQTVNVGRHVGGALAAAPFDLSSGLYGVARAFVDQANDSPVMREVKARGERTILDPVADWLTSQQQQGKAMADSASGPDPESFVGQSLKSGIRSVPSTVVALGLSAFGMPELGLGILSAQTGGGAYGDARDKGVDPDQAAIYAASQAAIEYGTEKIPVLKYFEDTKVGTPFARKLVNNILSELGGEEAATAGQDFNEWAVLHPERSFADYVRDRPSAALSTAIAVAVGSSVAVSAEHSLSKIAARNTPGIIETARDQSSIIMPEDDASPLPNELIAAGRAELAGAEAMPAADDILARNGAPKVGSRVSFNMGGRNVAGTINDAFSIDGGEAGSEHGVKITLDDGSVVSEPFSVLNDMGVQLAPLSDVPPEVAALGPEKSPSIFDVASGRSATENRRELRKSAYVANAGAAGSTSLSSMEADLRNGDTVALATPDGDILYVSQSGKDEFHFKSDVQEAYFNRTQLDQVLDRAKAKVAMDAPKPTGDGANDVSPDDGPSLDDLLSSEAVNVPRRRDDERAPGVMPVQGRITSPFGHRDEPKAGASTNHNGVDIATPIGTAVRAPAGGTVVNVGHGSKQGNFVVIDHGNGLTTGYAHLSGTTLKPGDRVDAGQDIATSGNTGNSTGPHLHWTARINGQAVDPTTVDFGQMGNVATEPSTVTSEEEATVSDADPGFTPVNIRRRGEGTQDDMFGGASMSESQMAARDSVGKVLEEARAEDEAFDLKKEIATIAENVKQWQKEDGRKGSFHHYFTRSELSAIPDSLLGAVRENPALVAELERSVGITPSAPAEQVPIAAGIAQQAGADGWARFADNSGTLNVPRADMPQIAAEHRGAMVNFLNARGIDHQEETIPAEDLKPTQAEFSPEKVQKAKDYEGGDRAILTSSDGYVLDGHHQWMAALSKGENVRTIKLDAPIAELLKTVPEFPSATDANGSTDTKPVEIPQGPRGTTLGQPVRFTSKGGNGTVTFKYLDDGRLERTITYDDGETVRSHLMETSSGETWESVDGGPQNSEPVFFESEQHARDAARHEIPGELSTTQNPQETAAQEGNAPAQSTGAEAPAATVEDFTDKSAIVRGLDDSETSKALVAKGLPEKGVPMWNAKAGGWVISKKHADKVRSIIAAMAASGAADRFTNWKPIVEPAPSAPTPTTPSQGAAYGTSNKVFTADAAEKARALLKSKFNQINSGFDPELAQAGLTLVGFHIEAGARSFIDAARAVAQDLGVTPADIKGHLRSWYLSARMWLEDNGHDVRGMDDADAVAVDMRRIDQWGSQAAPESGIRTGNADESRLSGSDAGASPADVQPAAQDRGAGSVRAEEGARSSETVRGSDERGGQAAERRGERPADQAERGRTGSRNADRLSGRDAERRLAGENFSIEPGALDEERGPMAKARDNVAAIELVKKIKAEGRFATREEQDQIARYVGWGGLKGAFPDERGNFGKGFEQIGQRLTELLTEEEYATARRSIQYAHYTSETIVREMWRAAERLGFSGGRVFEPGMGTGNFAGMMTPSLKADVHYEGIEMDGLTADIAKALYPKWGIRQADYTAFEAPKDAFDLVIGNPPFSDTVVKADREYKARGFVLHDYFFAKSLDSVRPGGLLMFVTSAGTMNKLDTTAREYLADRAELVGAIRLPGGAFAKNAGTEVTTDIVILRKLVPGEASTDRAWTETSPVTLPTKDGTMKDGRASRYFVDNPDMVLGEQGFFDRLYPERYAVRPTDGDLNARLRGAIDALPSDVMKEWTPAKAAEIDLESDEKKNGTFYVGKDGRLMQQHPGGGRPVEARGKGVEGGISIKDQEIIRGLVPIRDALRDVYRADLAENAKQAESAREELNRWYDAFVAKNGPINKAVFQYRRPNRIQLESARRKEREAARERGEPWDDGSFDPEPWYDARATLSQIATAREEARLEAEKRGRPWDEGSFDPEQVPDTVIEKRPNVDAFMDDPESYRLRAIEHYNDMSGEAKKSRVFFESVVTKESEPKIESAEDALFYTLNQHGRVDPEAIANVAGISPADAIEKLTGKIFRTPDGDWQTAPKYLSGNVRKKLVEAEAAAQGDPSYRANVEALRAVIPPDLGPSEVRVTLGMPWVPAETVDEFATKALGLGRFNATYQRVIAQWTVDGDRTSAAATSDWGTVDRDASRLIADALNGQSPKIYDTFNDGTSVLNATKTQAAQDKLNAIKQRFSEWIWQDADRTERLLRYYNDNFNNLVAPEYDGAYLTTPSIAASWSWRPHQKRVIARILQDGNTYVAHAVGAGKTSEMIGAAMEMKRLGLVNKPMFVVPNHMLAQFTKEFYEQYPLARIMVADDSRNFIKDKRKQFVADMSVADIDAVIIKHSAFELIPLSDEYQARYIRQELDELRTVLGEMKAAKDTNRVTRAKIEGQIEKAEQRMRATMEGAKDQTFTFEETGIDFLFVDEAHLFRKLDFATSRGDVKGIDPKGSMASLDLFMKTRYLEERRPGRSHVLASGTPITNTMAELFSISRYLQPQALRERGLERFDAWAASFGDTVTELEQRADGSYKPVSRFARFVNVPELSAMVRQIMDVVTPAQLEQYVVRPKATRHMVIAEQSDAQSDYQSALAARMQEIENRSGKPQPGDDIMLTVINDGRHASIDMRLVDPTLPADPGSKLMKMIDNVYRIWRETKNAPFHAITADGFSAEPIERGPAAQMIFSDLGIGPNRPFNVHKEIADELVRRGIPRNEIVLFNPLKNDVQKQRVFNDVNAGNVRILIGSVPKMGTGVNAQRRLRANHNLDPQWYPANDEQRNGRIIRQGNLNPEIDIYDYSTKGTYDSTMWGLMGKKAKFIEGFFRGDPTLRDMEDLGEASQYEQAKALTTNDPRILYLTEAKTELEKETRRKTAFERDITTSRRRAADARGYAESIALRIAAQKKDIARRQSIAGEDFKAVVDGKTYTDRAEFQTALDDAVDAKRSTVKPGLYKVGEIGGFDLVTNVTFKDHVGGLASSTVTRGLEFSPIVHADGSEDRRWREISASGSSASVQSYLARLENDLASSEQDLARETRNAEDFAARAANAGTFTGDARIAELQGTVNRIEAELSAEAAARDAARQGKADPEAEQIVKPSFEEPGEESNNLVVSGEADRAIQAKYRDVVDRMVARMEQLGLISHDVALHATDTIIGSPKAAGTYRYKLISIALKLARDPEATLNHEAIHALRALGVIKAPEWTALVRAAHADKKLMASINRRYSEYYKDEPNRAELLDEEAVADMFAAYSQGRYDLNRTPNRGLVRRALDKIGQWLGIVEKAAREAGLTAEQATQAEAVLRAIDDGTIGARRSQRDGDSIVKPSIEAGDKHEFESTETETRFREAMKGMGTPQSLLVRFKEGVTRLAEGFSRHWEHLPNVPGYAGLQQKLRALESAPQAARERTVRMLSSLTKDFSKDDLDLLARKVILDDLMWEVEQEHALPFGLTPETLRIERQRVDAIVERNPKVAEAVLRRKVVNRRVAQDLVEAGVLEAERIKNPAYFRHQVLEYAMSERRIAGDPKKKLRTPRWAQRMGSSLDINANLLEAEFDWLTKAFTDIPTAKAIEWIKKSEHNILPDIRQQAKDSNREALAAKIAEWEQQAENGDEDAAFELLKEKQFRKDIAIGFKFLGDALSESGVDHLPESLQRAAEGIIGGMSRDADKVFPLLSYILDNDLDGSPGAAMVLKAVSQRRMWMAQVLGRRYVDPSDIEEVIKRFAPEGYSLWSPEDGALLYTVKTLPEHVMDRMIDRLEAPEGVDPAEFRAYLRKTRDVLAIGTGRYRMVLPDEVVATLNNVRNVHNEGIFEHLVGPVLASWKRWTLINPRRVLKYNINNLSGDLDAIIAGNPSVLKRVPQAASELTRVALKKAKPSDLYIEAVDRGVFDSGLSVQEIPDINALSQFEKLTDADRGLVKKFADQTIGRAWHALQGTTQWRENVLRYAAYIDYAQRLAANEPMSKIGYGASVPEMVDAVVDQKDKAALLARDLVGDYGAISHYGADLRKYVIPFYSWMEINAKRYWRLTYNAYGQGIGKGIATGGGLALAKGVRASVVLSVRMGLLFGLIQLFNHLLFPDEEDELSRDQQRQMHLILGRDRNGEIITLRLQGAFSDALSWFGFSDVVDAMDAYEKGQTSALGVLTAAPKNVLNKVGTSISPVFTLPLESATQRKLWPDLFQTRFIRDRWRNLFQTFSLENEYDAAAKRPSRGYARSWVDSVIYRRSPDETAYNEARGLAYDWLRTAKGQEGAGGFSSPRSNALYDWRKSRVFGDKASEDRALDRMIELGMTKGDLNASIKRAAPLGPIAKKDRAAFVQSLTDEEYQKLVRAQEFYERTFLD